MVEVKSIDGRVKVSVDSNRLAAYLTILPPEGEGSPVTLKSAQEAVKNGGVIYGVVDENIVEALKENNWEKNILIAEGHVPVDGQPGVLEYKFPHTQERLTPKKDEQGNVDYRDLGLIHNVQKGQQLVVKTPPTQGQEGRDVYGKVLLAKPGKEIQLPKGKNTVSDNEGLILYSAIDGNVTVKSGKVTVDSVFEVKGDVDYSTGNIQLNGDLIIRGMVTAGFKVVAEGDVEIKGLIENAEVVASGNIMVQGGITGSDKCIVKAGENIQARFIANSRVEAGKDIYVKEAVMQSQLRAGGLIRVSDKKATIVGGNVQAFKEVESRIIGSQLATQTVIEVGINPMYKDEYQVLMKEYDSKKKELAKIAQNVAKFQQSGRSVDSLDDNRKMILIKQLDDFKNYRKEIEEMESRISFLEEEFRSGTGAKVKAVDMVYPGVKVVIGQSIYVVNDPIKSSSFILEEGSIRIGSLR
ncbi:MAG: FapA family protein [Syntrophomonadaceae bacterium]|jgi:uncharacterized protein (DUF342 family)|nr:FapA family protein [Syntrophomonadaceae bacterium]